MGQLVRATPPPAEPTGTELALVWAIRVVALLVLPPLLGLALGVAVRIFRIVAGVG